MTLIRKIELVLKGLQFATLDAMLAFISAFELTGVLIITDSQELNAQGRVMFYHGIPVKDGNVLYNLTEVEMRKEMIGVIRVVPISCLGENGRYTFGFEIGHSVEKPA